MNWFTTLLRRFPVARACGLAVDGSLSVAVVAARTPVETFVESRWERQIEDGDVGAATSWLIQCVRDRYGELPPLCVGLRPADLFFELRPLGAEQISMGDGGLPELVTYLPPSLTGLDVLVEAMPETVAGEPMLHLWAARRETVTARLESLGPVGREVGHLIPSPLALAAAVLADRSSVEADAHEIHVITSPGTMVALLLCGRSLIAWHSLTLDADVAVEEAVAAGLRDIARRARHLLGVVRPKKAVVHVGGGVTVPTDLAAGLTAALGFDIVVDGTLWSATDIQATGLALAGLAMSARVGSLLPRVQTDDSEKRPFMALVRWGEAATLTGLMVLVGLLATSQTVDLRGRLRILESRTPLWAQGMTDADLNAHLKSLDAKLGQVEEFLGTNDLRWTRALEALSGALPDQARLNRAELMPESAPDLSKSKTGGRLVLNLEVDASDEILTAGALRTAPDFRKAFPSVQLVRLKAPVTSTSSGQKTASFEIRAREGGRSGAATPRPGSR